MATASIELVYKTAGGKLPAGKGVAEAVRQVFRMQEQVDNPSTFRHWDKRLAGIMEDAILDVLAREANKAAKGQQLDRKALAADLLVQARARAAESAAAINGTTASMEAGEPFSAARAVAIGLTEASWAAHKAQELVLRAAGAKSWTWRCNSGSCCEHCRKLDGKKLRIGQRFKSGDFDVEHPPLHPSCRCRLEAS